MIRFNETIKKTIQVLSSRFQQGLPDTVLVRDALGSITVVLADNALVGQEEWESLAKALNEALGKFSPGIKNILLGKEDLIDADDVMDSPVRVRLQNEHNVWLVDRLMTNQDWIRSPLCIQPALPTATGFSIKGGVGRSTALTVLAWHLARLGKRVLVVDLDLEAPGIGTMLLPELPDYGVVDWCVESLADQADYELFEESCASAPLAEETDGDILVLPAFGRRTDDYVAKLGRASMPSADQNGQLKGLADRIQALLLAASKRSLEPPDVILLDSRAGLHDIGSAAVTQLGAEVFMFARNDTQTWEAYSRLFRHLRQSKGVEWGMPDSDLRWRLKMVAAQVEPTSAALNSWIEQSYRVWTELYDEEKDGGHGSPKSEQSSVFERDDESASHYPLSIDFDSRIRSFNFAAHSSLRPNWDVVNASFGRFLQKATLRLFPDPDSIITESDDQ